MRLTIALLALVFLPAVSMQAVEGNDLPLAQTKEQLQQLKKDDSAQKIAPGSAKLQLDLPTLKSPGAAWEAPQGSARPENNLDRQNARPPRAWLLDGVKNLEKNSQAKTGAGQTKREAEAPDPNAPKPSDPDYFLYLYEKEKRTAELEASKKISPARETAPVDPLAPFLQDWLANSPVREAALAAGRQPAAQRSASSPSGTEIALESAATTKSELALSSSQPDELSVGVRHEPANPFLQALNPVQNSATGSPALPTSSPTIATPEFFRSQPPAGQIPRTEPASTQALKPPRSQAEEDKKYFPQLKRF